MRPQNFLSKILFVIVVYKKDPAEVLHYVLPFWNSTMAVYLFDNSPCPQGIDKPNVFYRHNPANDGLGKAYNEGYKLSLKIQKEWLVLFDQDTQCTCNYLLKLEEAISASFTTNVYVPILKDQKSIVSPFRWKNGTGKRIKVSAGKLPLDQYRFANSGLCIHTQTFSLAGGYNENIPVDFSDIAFGDKLRSITGHFTVVDELLTHDFFDRYLEKPAALKRFRFYNRGAIEMGKITNQTFLFMMRRIFRATHLSLRFKSMRFIRILFE